MHLSRENGFFTNADGDEVFVKKGVLYADESPEVRGVPSIFDKVSDDAPAKSGPRRVPVTASAPAAAAARVKGSK